MPLRPFLGRRISECSATCTLQILRLGHGNVTVSLRRDCSVSAAITGSWKRPRPLVFQSRSGRVVRNAAVQLVRTAGYRNAYC